MKRCTNGVIFFPVDVVHAAMVRMRSVIRGC